ncbi:MAG: uroporphyrinogen-III C-methyltransferase [Deltaproteobacteria bacterium]|nr:uroporphyrinogen-III C-methyltransferase [Deltaproteobacteria bacterium]MBW2259241.1 uroporphyrinogen-III C-methyltransferase [Deltaproteobacteria bacterium]
MTKGTVYLVGAGPGDPGLITVKAVECLKQADVVIYDFLATPKLLKYAREGAEIIYVGKKGGDHTLSQDKINELIAAKAKEGNTVVRLKGGDPFIFGRGGEEAEVLVQQGIPFEIVPGVTSAIAAPAYAGIPLTHRKYNTSVAFITGHEDPTKDESTIEWSKLATAVGTLVFLMGVKSLPTITENLIAAGRDPKTPVALVRWGTTSQQTTVTGTLETIVAEVEAAGLKPPAIIVVGEVAELRDTLNWFEKRPLLGKTIVVTRARAQASDLVDRLSDLGAECFECPTIKVVPPEDWSPLDSAIDNLGDYDWLVFTSVNGVAFFFERLFERGKDVRALRDVRTAAIGPATAKRLGDFGLTSDIVPETYQAESVVEAFAKESMGGKRVLLPRAKEARPILPVELKNMGADVDEIATYETEQASENIDMLIKRLEEGSIDIVTFTSSSTVKNFKALLPADRFQSLIEKVTVASIGPITTDTAKELGFKVDITAADFTIPGLCEAILQHYA